MAWLFFNGGKNSATEVVTMDLIVAKSNFTYSLSLESEMHKSHRFDKGYPRTPRDITCLEIEFEPLT